MTINRQDFFAFCQELYSNIEYLIDMGDSLELSLCSATRPWSTIDDKDKQRIRGYDYFNYTCAYYEQARSLFRATAEPMRCEPFFLCGL